MERTTCCYCSFQSPTYEAITAGTIDAYWRRLIVGDYRRSCLHWLKRIHCFEASACTKWHCWPWCLCWLLVQWTSARLHLHKEPPESHRHHHEPRQLGLRPNPLHHHPRTYHHSISLISLALIQSSSKWFAILNLQYRLLKATSAFTTPSTSVAAKAARDRGSALTPRPSQARHHKELLGLFHALLLLHCNCGTAEGAENISARTHIEEWR